MNETRKFFREKEKEARRKEMENLLNTKRSSSRIETLKKTQEEKDRLLAIQVFLLFISAAILYSSGSCIYALIKMVMVVREYLPNERIVKLGTGLKQPADF